MWSMIYGMHEDMCKSFKKEDMWKSFKKRKYVRTKPISKCLNNGKYKLLNHINQLNVNSFSKQN